MLTVSEHQTCGVSGRGYREFRGERYWYWPTRDMYGSQTGGKQRLLHLEVYRAIHGNPHIRAKILVVDGDMCNTTPENWIIQRSERARKHRVQELDGIRFYWKPEGYYKAEHVKHGGITMHRYVWAKHNGAIPDGFHVHHRDGDKGNNAIENLELLSASEHSLHHAPENEWVGSAANRKQIVAAGELAKAWHSSDEGIAWHKAHGVDAWKNREWHSKKCEECRREYFTPYPTRSKFCHSNCKLTALRRRRGLPVGVRPNSRKTPLLSRKLATGK